MEQGWLDKGRAVPREGEYGRSDEGRAVERGGEQRRPAW